MHHRCGGQACVAVTSSTQVLHWMHYLIEYVQYTLQWKLSLHLTSEGNEVLRVGEGTVCEQRGQALK